MISQYLTSIEGIEIFGIAGLILSVICFAAITVRALRASARHIGDMERLPLDGSSDHLHEAER
jgi:hypothetical protein